MTTTPYPPHHPRTTPHLNQSVCILIELSILWYTAISLSILSSLKSIFLNPVFPSHYCISYPFEPSTTKLIVSLTRLLFFLAELLNRLESFLDVLCSSIAILCASSALSVMRKSLDFRISPFSSMLRSATLSYKVLHSSLSMEDCSLSLRSA